jgi:nucleoside-diphosphate-sugar epimerase
VACADRGAPGDVYNLASGEQTSIRALAELIIQLIGSRSELEIGPRRPWDHSIMRFGSTEKARSELGFEADVALEDGLRRTIEWTRDNLDLIDRCIERYASRLEPAVA